MSEAGARVGDGPPGRAAGDRRRHPDQCPVLRRAPRGDGGRGDQGRGPGGGDFMRTIGPFVPTGGDDSGLLPVVGRRGKGTQGGHPRPPPAPGPGAVPPAGSRTPTWCARTSGPGPWRGGTSGPTGATPAWCGPASACSARTARTHGGPAWTGSGMAFGGLLGLTGFPDGPPVRPGVTVSDYLTGVFAAEAVTAALYRRDRPDGGTGRGRRGRRPAVRIGAAHPGVDHRRPGPSGHDEAPRREPAAQLGAARQLSGRRRALRLHRGRIGRQLRPAVRGHGTDRSRGRSPVVDPGPAGGRRRRDQRTGGGLGGGPRRPTRSKSVCIDHGVPVGHHQRRRRHRGRPPCRRPGATSSPWRTRWPGPISSRPRSPGWTERLRSAGPGAGPRTAQPGGVERAGRAVDGRGRRTGGQSGRHLTLRVSSADHDPTGDATPRAPPVDPVRERRSSSATWCSSST